MAGLMNPQGQPPAPAPGPAAPMGGGGAPEQESYNSLVNNASQILYDPKTMPGILKSIDMAPNPVEGLANAVSQVMTRVEDAGAEAGQQFTPKARSAAAKEIGEMLAELVQSAGIHKFSQEELGNAFQLASAQYGQIHGPNGRKGPQPQQGQPPAQPPAQPGGLGPNAMGMG
jgi:hypothetical protein